jgi:hypothetical protein
MPTKFLENLGSKLAEKWLSTLLTPAFVFWAGGLGAWIYRYGWSSLETWLTKQSQSIQIALLIIALLSIISSALIVQNGELIVLRFLEGYWPRSLRKLRNNFIKIEQNKKDKLLKRFQLLLVEKENQNKHLSSEEIEEIARLNSLLHYFPIYLMPTQLGNILRAAEERPRNQYGLDTFICWPRLWLLLPDSVKTELTEARTTLNIGARIWLWSVLFLIWTPLAWWAIPTGTLSAYLSYRWLLNSAIIYSDLLESAFDLYRFELYKSLRFALPKSSQEERQLGEQLTAYLWKRSGIFLDFCDPKE